MFNFCSFLLSVFISKDVITRSYRLDNHFRKVANAVKWISFKKAYRQSSILFVKQTKQPRISSNTRQPSNNICHHKCVPARCRCSNESIPEIIRKTYREVDVNIFADGMVNIMEKVQSTISETSGEIYDTIQKETPVQPLGP